MSEENMTDMRNNNTFGIPAAHEKKMNNGYTPGRKSEENKRTTPEEYFRWGVFGTTLLLLFMAAIQLYFSIQEVIHTWFEWQYVPLFKSLYNLVIIVLCVYIIKLYIFRKQT
ncbi:hypothetical protein [Methanolobus sp.]|uniref:hypothetical protein n=1 Tax=Methanolobus sp. TaxID=1874737 RepID=UPI0025CDA770|nr:hypothetical protein [Methanolobus sp.]